MFILETENLYETAAINEEIENKLHWFLIRRYDWTFKKIDLYDFSSFNTILDDYLVWKIALSNLSDDEKNKR